MLMPSQAACVAGLGIIQVPYVDLRDLVHSGAVRLQIPQYEARPMPLSPVYASRRNQPTRARVVMDWLARVVTEHCALDAG